MPCTEHQLPRGRSRGPAASVRCLDRPGLSSLPGLTAIPLSRLFSCAAPLTMSPRLSVTVPVLKMGEGGSTEVGNVQPCVACK